MHEDEDDMQNDDEDEQKLSSSDGASDDEQKVQYECEVIENIYFYVPLLSDKTNEESYILCIKVFGT